MSASREKNKRKEQAAAPETDVITGLPFTKDGEEVEMENTFDITTLRPEQQAYLASLSQEELDTLMASYMQPWKADSK